MGKIQCATPAENSDLVSAVRIVGSSLGGEQLSFMPKGHLSQVALRFDVHDL